MPVRVLVPVADGSEDIETVTLVDVLRRARFEVSLASVHARTEVVAARGTRLVADQTLDRCADTLFDLIACPGGMPGATHLRDCAILRDMLVAQHRAKRYLAAICAAPAVVLAHHGLLDDVPATCHPAFHHLLPRLDAASRVLRHGHITTSQGPGTALEFALSLVEQAGSGQLRDEVAAPMVVEGF